MSSPKSLCSELVSKLEMSALKCEEFLRNTSPKLHCINPAKGASSAGKTFVEVCKKHTASCKNQNCTAACTKVVALVEKAIEKNNACVSACSGAGSDNDCKIVCKDCAQASRDAASACKAALPHLC